MQRCIYLLRCCALLCVWVSEVLRVHPSLAQAAQSPVMSSYEGWQPVYLGRHFLDISAWFGADYQLMADSFIGSYEERDREGDKGKGKDLSKKMTKRCQNKSTYIFGYIIHYVYSNTKQSSRHSRAFKSWLLWRKLKVQMHAGRLDRRADRLGNVTATASI